MNDAAKRRGWFNIKFRKKSHTINTVSENGRTRAKSNKIQT